MRKEISDLLLCDLGPSLHQLPANQDNQIPAVSCLRWRTTLALGSLRLPHPGRERRMESRPRCVRSLEPPRFSICVSVPPALQLGWADVMARLPLAGSGLACSGDLMVCRRLCCFPSRLSRAEAARRCFPSRDGSKGQLSGSSSRGRFSVMTQPCGGILVPLLN